MLTGTSACKRVCMSKKRKNDKIKKFCIHKLHNNPDIHTPAPQPFRGFLSMQLCMKVACSKINFEFCSSAAAEFTRKSSLSPISLAFVNASSTSFTCVLRSSCDTGPSACATSSNLLPRTAGQTLHSLECILLSPVLGQLITDSGLETRLKILGSLFGH